MVNGDFLTVRDAARRIAVSYSTLKQWIYKGSVRTIRTDGGHHRVPAEEVARLLSATGAPPPKADPEPTRGVLVALSGRNQLRGIVEEVRVEGLIGQVRLRIGNQRLTAVITRDALDELRLRRGEEALAIIKATEVMIGREQSPRSTPRAASKRPSARRRTR